MGRLVSRRIGGKAATTTEIAVETKGPAVPLEEKKKRLACSAVKGMERRYFVEREGKGKKKTGPKILLYSS